MKNVLHTKKNQSTKWRKEEDEALVIWMEVLSRTNGISPINLDHCTFNCSKDILSKFEKIQNESNISSNRPTQYSKETGNETVISRILQMYVRHTVEEIEVRALLLIHMNDLILPFLPLVVPVDGSKVHIGGTNHPTWQLMRIRSLVFLSVTSEFTYKVCSTYTHPPVRTTTTEERTGINPNNTKVSDRSNSPAFSPIPVPIHGSAVGTNPMRVGNLISSFSSPGGMSSFSPIQIPSGVHPPILNSLSTVINDIQTAGSSVGGSAL